MLQRSIIILLSFFYLTISFAQELSPVELKFLEDELEQQSLSLFVQKTKGEKRHEDRGQLVIIQADKNGSLILKNEIQALDLLVLDYIPEYNWLMYLPPDFDMNQLLSIPLRSIWRFQPEWKIFPSLNNSEGKKLKVLISLIPGVKQSDFIRELTSRFNVSVLGSDMIPNNAVAMLINKQDLLEIADLPFVYAMDRIPDVPTELRDEAVKTLRIDQIKQVTGLSGKNLVVGVGDGGATGMHYDLMDHQLDLTDGRISGHAAHVSGIVAGRPILEERHGAGMAHNASLINATYSNILNLSPALYTEYGMTITNNSYGAITGDCNFNGMYDIQSAFVDEQLYDLPFLSHVFASGNDGWMTCGPYPSGFGTVLNAWQSSKNVLTIGNCRKDGKLFVTSSKGPTLDGRIKPEVVAVGMYVGSTNTNNRYTGGSGTSMASPMVAGLVALLQEYYQRELGQMAPSYLLKNIISNSADDQDLPGPDFISGFGRINGERAVQLIEERRYTMDVINSNSSYSMPIEVPAGQARLKVMLYWNDPAASPLSSRQLVNDLNLRVSDLNAMEHLPLIPDPEPINVALPAIQGTDHLNNIEQVTIQSPERGEYMIHVDASDLPSGQSSFSLSWEWVEEERSWHWPTKGAALTADNTEVFLWEVQPPMAGFYRLDISYDGGNSWEILADSIPADFTGYAYKLPKAFYRRVISRATHLESGILMQSDTFSIIPQPESFRASESCPAYHRLEWSSPSPGIRDFILFRFEEGEMIAFDTIQSETIDVEKYDADMPLYAVASYVPDLGRSYRTTSLHPEIDTFQCDADKDMALLSINIPLKGRDHTSSSLSDQRIGLTVMNTGTESVNEFEMGYHLDGSNPIIRSVDSTLLPGERFTFVFDEELLVNGPGEYAVAAWVELQSDELEANDSLVLILEELENEPITIPFIEDFEDAEAAYHYGSDIGIGLDRMDHTDNSSFKSRLRTKGTSEFLETGNYGLFMENDPDTKKNVHWASLTFNLENYKDSADLMLTFHMANHEENVESTDSNYLYISACDSCDLVPLIDLHRLYIAPGLMNHIAHGFRIQEILEASGDRLSSSFRMVFQQEGNGRIHSPGRSDGFVIDDINFFSAAEDVRPGLPESKLTYFCESGMNRLEVLVENTFEEAVKDVEVSFRLDKESPFQGPFLVDLEAKQILNFEIPQAIDLNNPGIYNVEILVAHPDDNYKANDTLQNLQVFSMQSISADDYPYLESFENQDNSSWFVANEQDSWQIGEPTNSKISRAAEGNSCWVTSLDDNYRNNERSYLYSPCFDLSSLEYPAVSFAGIFDIELDYDYAWMEYRLSSENHWQKLFSSLENSSLWYEEERIGWSGSQPYWRTFTAGLEPLKGEQVQFRFVFDSDQGLVKEGFGLDMFHVYDLVPISEEISFSEQYTGGVMIDFEHLTIVDEHFNLIAELDALSGLIKPIGFEMKTDTVASSRHLGKQYYLDRNWYSDYDLMEGDTVKYKLYFTQNEVDSLIFASGCDTCTTISDAFQLGVTRYIGQIGDTSLNNNQDYSYDFIQADRALVVPYDKGYFVEFKSNHPGEFYLNGGGPFMDLAVDVVEIHAGKLDLYPNPAFVDDQINLTIPESNGEIVIYITDIHGKQLMRKTINTSVDGFNFTFSPSLLKLNSGIYLISVTSNTIRSNQGFILYEK